MLMYYVVALYDIHYWPCLEVTLLILVDGMLEPKNSN